MKKRKQALFHSVIALLLCVSMLIGTTFAWLTDGVTSGNNVIVAGNLDVVLEYLAADGKWYPVEEDTNVFEENTLWEPGHTEVVYLRVSNQGSLALRYQLGVNIAAEAGSVNVYGEPFVLSDYIEFDAIENVQTPYADRNAARAAVKDPEILSTGYTKNDSLEAGDDPHYVAFVVYMPEDVGNEANYRTGERAPEIALGISLFAAQHSSERDSFGTDYDLTADFPEMALPDGGNSDIPVVDGVLADQITISGDNVSAEVPAGVQVESGATTLTLTVTEMETTGSNLTIAGGEVLKPVDVHLSGVSADNTTPIKVRLNGIAPTGLNLGNLRLFHVESGSTNAMIYVASEADLTAHNQFTYDPATGDVVLYMATFSEVSFVADTVNPWKGTVATAFAGGSGTEDAPYIIANADQLAYMGHLVSNDNGTYGSAHYKLIADVNIGGSANYNENGVIFYPIGYNKVGGEVAAASGDLDVIYFEPVNVAVPGDGVMTASDNAWYTYGGSFKGVFDATGHTVTGIYQNTWAMKGNYDRNYYNAAMGLFGYVNGGTVKNLTIDNFYSEGEYAPTGCVAAYAAGDATFENISITNSHPQTYNTGVAGIVGWDNGGDTEADASNFTFKNITVDSTNTISALWGSWDVAAAGVLGYLGTHSKADFENCNVTAVIDVYNDVCGNYQYYWYRYCGMLIGTVDRTRNENGVTVADTSGITARNCKVNFGQWNDYYYCELVANSQASYTHDHQFSRLTPIEDKGAIFDGENWTRTGNFVVINRDAVGDITERQCYHIVKNEEGQMVRHEHAAAGTEVVGGKEVYKEDKTLVFLPFEQVFGGYGWGVKGWDVAALEGVEVLGITKENVDKSVTKFLVNTEENSFRYGYAFTLDKFFKAEIGVAINSANVYVSVSPVGETSTAGAVFTPNAEDWTKGTLTFSGNGAAEIIITDYDLCLPTRYTVSVCDPVEEEKFKTNEDITPFQPSIFEAEPSHITFGTLFEEKDDALIVSEGITVTVVAPDKSEQVFTGAQWAEETIKFAGYGDYTVTITDQDHCITSTATLTIEAPDPVEKFAPVLPEEDSEPAATPCGDAIRLGDLFSLNDEYAKVLKQEGIQVVVTPLTGEAAMAVAAADDQAEETSKLFSLDDSAENWQDWTLTILEAGSYDISITDGYFCQEATTQLTVEARDAFAVKLPERDFLYRVGNQNAVSVGSLFTAKENTTINSETVSVTIEKLDEASDVSGVYTANTTDWTNGSIQFSGTGVVKVIISAVGAKDVTLDLEVINATNVTAYSELKNRNVTSVLLDDITMNNNSAFYLSGGATLYGNGFTFDCTNGAYTAAGSVSENYVIGLVDAHLDNVRVVGKVYTSYGAQSSNDYNRALVVSKGDSSITNCYLSNTASPVRLVEGSLAIKGTTVKGGNFANIDIRNGHLALENVTTINQANGNDKAADGTTVIGLGVVVFYENVDTSLTSVTIKGTLTQHNNISSNDQFTNDYAKQFVNQMMKEEYSELQTVIDNVTWVNSGIIAMTDGVKPVDNRAENAGYDGKDVSFLSYDGYVYTVVPTNELIEESPNTDVNVGQGFIAPTYSFNYTEKNYVAKTEGSNDYCYYENGKVLIAMDQGDTFQWDPFILTATKLGKTLDYTVSMNGTTYTAGQKIAFNESGDYEVIYTYTDDNNYVLGDNGEISTTSQTYTKTVSISVSVIKPTTQHATFTFADTNTATEKVTVNDKTYISAKGVSVTDKEWGYITVNGTNIFYPITEAQMKKNALGNEVQVYYYVFKDAVTITDYKDGGTGGEQKYDASTTTMPTNLTVVNGMEAKYTGINSACVDVSKLTKDGPSGEVWDFSASTTVSGTTKYNNYLAHSSPSGLAIKSGTRDYDAITVAQFSYTDAAGATYYYFVGYFMPNQVSSDGGSCVTPDTMITLADGKRVRVDSLKGNEQLLVWNMETGKLDSAPILFVDNDPAERMEIIHLYFSDGTSVKVISEHGFWDYDLNKYVYLDRNAVNYLNHTFAKHDGNTLTKVKLTQVTIKTEETTAWSPVTAGHLCYFVNGMLSMPGGVGGLFNIFDVDAKTMTYDYAAMERDIAKYGLFTYEELNAIAPLSREMFEAAGGAYLKVSIGKGNLTMDELVYMITRYSKFFN